MKALRKYLNIEINVRKMSKEEMPDNGIIYYCDDFTKNIYESGEIILLDNDHIGDTAEKVE